MEQIVACIGHIDLEKVSVPYLQFRNVKGSLEWVAPRKLAGMWCFCRFFFFSSFTVGIGVAWLKERPVEYPMVSTVDFCFKCLSLHWFGYWQVYNIGLDITHSTAIHLCTDIHLRWILIVFWNQPRGALEIIRICFPDSEDAKHMASSKEV